MEIKKQGKPLNGTMSQKQIESEWEKLSFYQRVHLNSMNDLLKEIDRLNKNIEEIKESEDRLNKNIEELKKLEDV